MYTLTYVYLYNIIYIASIRGFCSRVHGKSTFNEIQYVGNSKIIDFVLDKRNWCFSSEFLNINCFIYRKVP